MKKRLLSLLLILTFAISLVACGNKEKGEDSSFKFTKEEQGTIKENKYITTDGNLVMDVPENWILQEVSGTTVITSPDYPTTTDNITVLVSDDTSGFGDLTKESFESYYASIFSDFKMDSFEEIEVDGEKAISLSYTMSTNGVAMTQYQYLIKGDSLSTITFTDVSGEFKDSVKTCVDSIDLR